MCPSGSLVTIPAQRFLDELRGSLLCEEVSYSSCRTLMVIEKINRHHLVILRESFEERRTEESRFFAEFTLNKIFQSRSLS